MSCGSGPTLRLSLNKQPLRYFRKTVRPLIAVLIGALLGLFDVLLAHLTAYLFPYTLQHLARLLFDEDLLFFFFDFFDGSEEGKQCGFPSIGIKFLLRRHRDSLILDLRLHIAQHLPRRFSFVLVKLARPQVAIE